MQTFLPYPDFAATAAVLDDRRLGKQRVEGLQVVRAIFVPNYAWRHHPAALMWKGYEEALQSYLMIICDEWVGRGYADTCRNSIRARLAEAGIGEPLAQSELAAADRLPPLAGRRSPAPEPPRLALAQGPGVVRPVLPDIRGRGLEQIRLAGPQPRRGPASRPTEGEGQPVAWVVVEP